MCNHWAVGAVITVILFTKWKTLVTLVCLGREFTRDRDWHMSFRDERPPLRWRIASWLGAVHLVRTYKKGEKLPTEVVTEDEWEAGIE